MNNLYKIKARAVLLPALLLILSIPALSQRLATVPVGSIIPLRMDTHLSSDSSRVGDRFTATVFDDVVINGRVIVPEGTKVEGHVSGVSPMVRGTRSGAIAIAFDRIIFPEGNSASVEGTLTALNEEERQQIERNFSNEDRVDSGSRARQSVVFLGTGSGTVIGAVPTDNRGAASANGVLGALSVLLGRGDRAEVSPGTQFAMLVERSFTVNSNTDRYDDNRDAGDGRVQQDRDRGNFPQRDWNSTESISAAQTALRERNYYNGPITGVMNTATRTAIINFQHDQNLESTGALNWRTAQALGIITGGGNQSPQDMFTSVESIRFAQSNLRDRGYYTGPISGIMNAQTREAIRQVQQENNLPTTGNLDARTGRLLGLASESGEEAKPIEIRNPNAERLGRNSIRISADVHTQGGGWQVFVNRFVSGNTLHVNIRGVPPRYSTGTAIDHHPFTETYDNLPNVTRVIIHGPQRDFTFNLLGNDTPRPGGTGGAANIGNPRQIAFLANRLLQDYQRDLNIRSNRGQLVYDTRRDFSTDEVDVLSQISSLQAAADVYNQLTTTVTDSEAVKGAADALLRQARLLDRLMKRYTHLTISPGVRRGWDQLQTELARINVTDVNLDSEIIR